MPADELRSLPKKIIDHPLRNVPGVLRAEGNLVLEEDVFHTQVEARGHIIVNGSAERSRLESELGSVFLLFGSTDYTNIKAGRNIYVRHSSNAGLTAGEDVVIEKSVYQSALRAGRKVQSETDDAKIVGGRVEARDQVDVHTIGSPNEVPTEVVVTNPKGVIVFGELFPGVALSIGTQTVRATRHLGEGFAMLVDGVLALRLREEQAAVAP